MPGACPNCKPDRKCMRCRKSHDSLQKGAVYEYPVQWVSYSEGDPPTHPVAVNGGWISRSTSSEPHKTMLAPFTQGSQNSILNDPNSRTEWKSFLTDFDPDADAVNAIKANHKLSGWIGSDIYVGKVTLNGSEVLGTIYREEGTGSSWKLYLGVNQLSIDEKTNPCQVLCDKLTLTDALTKRGK